MLGPNEGGTRSCDGCKLDFEQDFIEEGKINVADEQEAPKNPNEKMGFFNNSLPSHALVSTCWAEEVSDFQHPPTITTIKAIKTFWLCEEDPSHWIIMTPTFRLFQRRS